jgi:hypothetical protein
MNYISAIYGVIIVLIAADWLVRGRRDFWRGEGLNAIVDVASSENTSSHVH